MTSLAIDDGPSPGCRTPRADIDDLSRIDDIDDDPDGRSTSLATDLGPDPAFRFAPCGLQI